MNLDYQRLEDVVKAETAKYNQDKSSDYVSEGNDQDNEDDDM